MKSIMSFLMMIALVVMVMTSCEESNPIEPTVAEFPIIQFAISNSSGDETISQIQLEISLSEKFDKDVSTDYTIIGGTASTNDNDFSLNNGTVTIIAGELSTSITITVIDDEEEEGDETIIVALSDPVNATLGDQFWHTITILDNEITDRPTIQFVSTMSHGEESNAIASIELSLSSVYDRDISVDYTLIGGTATANDTDFVFTNGTVTIQSGNTTGYVEFELIDDDLIENIETIIIALSNPINAVLGNNFYHTYNVVDNETGYGELHLIAVGPDIVANAVTDDNGQMWLSRSELSYALYKAATASISFGEMLNTRTLQYVIMNVGNQDVFGINFSAQNLYIYPGAIGLIQASEQGTEVSALPIVNMVKEHVTPVSGVGSLLDMGIGNFTDTLSLTYYYTLGVDTVTVVDDYSVSGTKMGAAIEFEISGLPLDNYNINQGLFQMSGYNYDFTSYWGLVSEDLDTTFISNVGNAPLRVRVFFSDDNSVALDSMLQADNSIDLSGILRGGDFAIPDSSGESIILGDESSQPYIFTVDGRTIINGVTGLWFGEGL